MDLAQAFVTFLPWIEDELRDLLQSSDPFVDRHYAMLQYHMGWLDVDLQPVEQNSGKRIRPVLCLVACRACGGDPRQAVPAASGLELLHNFSLLHDDIEDNSATRRHRPTAWTVFGLPLAVNAGDAMFSVAHLAFYRLAERGVPLAQIFEALRVFDDMCLALTEGQFLDMSFEGRAAVEVPEYFRMVQGKTGALLGASAQIGALIAGAEPDVVTACRRYGRALGMAFQLQDDVLGIWGSEAVTGKSAASDILAKKMSLPVIYGMSDADVGPALRARYAGPQFTLDDVPPVLALLNAAGAREFTEMRAWEATAEAHQALRDAEPSLAPAAQAPLHELLDSLLGRQR
jgi:geranylgeranyl diphosphate synthase, type I